jgi:succinate dehydrogenase / fumarate reductase cytochrome b subunit
MRVLPETAVGKKILMGATGLVWIAFLIGHVAGNLLVFRGPSAVNHYSALLHASSAGLWTVRAVIYGALSLHVASGLALWRRGAGARRTAYARKTPLAATIASRTIRWTGLTVLAFIVFHVLHLSTGTIRPVPYEPANVYANVTRSFHVTWVAALYVVAMVAVALHVLHGTYASFKSLGLARLRANPFDRRLAILVAASVWAGFTVIPVLVFSGVLG